MGFFDGYDIATSGMSAQRTRINIVSANIANAETTHTIDGGPYKKQNVVFEEALLNEQNKNNLTNDEVSDNEMTNNNIFENKNIGVNIKSIVDANNEPLMKYEPNHPDANEDGYVAYPNINPVIEMVDLLEASRAYQANISSFTTQKSIDTKTLDIIKV